MVTPTVELNALAMKRGEPTVYSFLQQNTPPSKSAAPAAAATTAGEAASTAPTAGPAATKSSSNTKQLINGNSGNSSLK